MPNRAAGGPDFAPWLRRQLARRNPTQAEFARRAGVGATVVSNWVNGRTWPNRDGIVGVARALALDPSDVMAMAGLDVTPEADVPDDVRELLAAIRQMDPIPDRVEGLRAMVERFLEMDRAREEERVRREARPAPRRGSAR